MFVNLDVVIKFQLQIWFNTSSSQKFVYFLSLNMEAPRSVSGIGGP